MDALKVPFFQATIGKAEMDSVLDTLQSGWLTSGPKTRKFETEFAAKVNAKFAVAVNSATAALHLALEAAGVGTGDEVLVPTLTFAATAEVAIHLGAKPVLVDVDPETFNIDLEDLAKKYTPAAKAIIPVHYAGQPCDMQPILDFAQEKKLTVVEDAAHAFPAAYGSKMVGSISPMTCFSFYANKTITTGEGGMLTTNDEQLADRVRLMSLHGLSRAAWNRFTAKGNWYYEIEAAGYKYNLSDVAAAIGTAQLPQAENFRSLREQAAQKYLSAFADSDIVAPLQVNQNITHSWHLFVIKLQLEHLTIDRSEFINQLTQAGIGTSVHYTPLHLHPLYRNAYGYQPDDLPVASRIFEQIISLPLFPSITDQQIEYVIENVARIANENRH